MISRPAARTRVIAESLERECKMTLRARERAHRKTEGLKLMRQYELRYHTISMRVGPGTLVVKRRVGVESVSGLTA